MSQKSCTQELKEINNELIKNIIEYLETGVFKNKTPSYVSAYGKVIELTDQKGNEEKIYAFYGKTINNYTVKKVFNKFKAKQGQELLQWMIRSWENHQTFVYWMQKIFCYLDN